MASDLEEILALVARINPAALERGLSTLATNLEVDSIAGIGSAGLRQIVGALWGAIPSGSIASLPLLRRFLGQFRASKDKTLPPTRNAKLTLELISNSRISDLLRTKKSELGKVFAVVLKKENPDLQEKDVVVLFENAASALAALRADPECAKALEDLKKELRGIEDQRKVLEQERDSLWMRDSELEIEIAMLHRKEEKLYRDRFKELMSTMPQILMSSGFTGTGFAKSLEFLGASVIAVLGGTSLGDSVINASLAASEEDKVELIWEISTAVKSVPSKSVGRIQGQDGEKRPSFNETLKVALREEKGSEGRVFVVRSACAARLAAGDLSSLPLSADSMELTGRDIRGLKFKDCRLLKDMSLARSSLIKCDFTDAVLEGPLDLTGAVFDTETLRSLIPTLMEAKARGIEVKTDGVVLYHDGTSLDLTDTFLYSITVEESRTYRSYLWGNSPSTIKFGETTADHKDGVREARIARELSLAVATVEGWYDFPPVSGAESASVEALVRDMPAAKRATWDLVLKTNPVALIEHISANTEKRLQYVVTTFEDTDVFKSAAEEAAKQALKPRKTLESKDLKVVSTALEKSAKLLQRVIKMLEYREDDSDTRLGLFVASKIIKRAPTINPAVLRAVKKLKLAKVLAFILIRGIGTRKVLKLLVASKELGTNLQLAKGAVKTFAQREREKRQPPQTPGIKA